MPSPGEEDLKDAMSLTKARSILITYSMKAGAKILLVDSPQQVKEVIDTLEVAFVQKGVGYGKVPGCKFAFTLKDGTVKEAYLIRDDLIELRRWGVIQFKNKKLHSRIEEIVSKAEGRPIDILKLGN